MRRSRIILIDRYRFRTRGTRRSQQTQAMASTSDADILKRLIIEIGQEAQIDVVRFKRVAVLSETQRPQLLANIAHIFVPNSKSNAFASFKSFVSKPSVNQ